MTTVLEQINKLVIPDGYIELFVIDATNLPGGSIWRFTSTIRANLTAVDFQGNTYNPLPIYATGFGIKGDGSQSKPQLIVANTHRILIQAISSLGDLVGAHVTRYLTTENFLDGGVDAGESNRVIYTEKFLIEAKLEQSIQRIVFSLCSPMDAFGKRIPNRLVTRQGDSRYCTFPGAGGRRVRR